MADVLLVEDDPAIANLVRFVLQDAGFAVRWVMTGEEGLAEFQVRPPELLLLDIGLPDLSGYDICRQIRPRSSVPILVLTALARDEDVIRGLEAGADDYLTKPFSPLVLIARINALLRRTTQLREPPAGLLSIGELTVDFVRCQVSRDGRPLPLTPTEFRLLRCLALRPGEVVSSRLLIREAQEYECDDQEAQAIVKVHISHLRNKIEPSPIQPRYLINVRGFGYLLQA